jgi:hypothetical protein
MGQTVRTTKLLLDLSQREQGGANRDKRCYLEETVAMLDAARRFYLDFLLAHPQILMERVEVISKQTGEASERLISADKLLTWAEFQTVETEAHPDPLPEWNFSQAFPDFPNRYRRSVIKDCIGKARGYLTMLRTWQQGGNKKGKPAVPTAANHPTLYAGTYALELDTLDLRESFVRLKVYTGSQWVWVHYPTRYNRYFEARRAEQGWEQESPKLILGKQTAAIHFLQSKTITATKIVESKRDPDLVTVAVDLNVKQLAVITVRQHGMIIQTRFVSTTDWISTAITISNGWRRSNGNRASRSKGNVVISSSGGISAVRTRMSLIRRHEPLSTCVSSIRAVYCSSNACG